ncbi:MAG TPA: haloacid dehalogenase type II [Gammaproteobacteria bacterium]|nr:haloacid dehalogenase type II [Gammaproteobacteria bacterium]
MITLAFDIYGTLINPAGITERLHTVAGDKASAFARLWREKQLEYTFRRGLMNSYRDFTVCVQQALQFTAANLQITLSKKEKDRLMVLYLELPAFIDAERCLQKLNCSEFRVYALSNGTLQDVLQLLAYNQLQKYFLEVISVEEIRTFKPDPAVYHYFLEKSRSEASDSWLVSSNPFDVIGAISAGMQAAWIQRHSNTVFDPWEIRPTITLQGLDALPETILQYHS